MGGAPQSTLLAGEQESGHWVILHVSVYIRTEYKFYSLPMHTEVAGFGVQVPFGDLPSDVHTAVIFLVGTNPVLHLKIILAPLNVLGIVTMEPLSGAIGIPQLTGRRGNDNAK